ncbi:MAG TPA: tRNA pseudouridine(55) synthase TruB [Dehalococcoidia bacterium]|nr:tRNA pseudouridine(55) synthase TruB [Dehalococcoidia bacterium]
MNSAAKRHRRPGLDASGLLLIDKPSGWTSHDVVARMRRIVGQRRIGHTGTLDPAATGLLVLCLGRATRLVEYMTEHRKRYKGSIRLGISTNTDDAEGDVISTTGTPDLNEDAVRDLELGFTGDIQQRPPVFSAVKVKGQRAYAAARRGSPLELAERPVHVDSLKLQRDGDHLRFELLCGPGTYVRSIARDIGASIGCGAHLAELRRTEIGKARVENAFTLEQVAELTQAGLLPKAVRPADEGLLDWNAALLSAEKADQIRNGNMVRVATKHAAERVRIYGADGLFLATARVGPNGQIRPLKVLEPSNRT